MWNYCCLFSYHVLVLCFVFPTFSCYLLKVICLESMNCIFIILFPGILHSLFRKSSWCKIMLTTRPIWTAAPIDYSGFVFAYWCHRTTGPPLDDARPYYVAISGQNESNRYTGRGARFSSSNLLDMELRVHYYEYMFKIGVWIKKWLREPAESCLKYWR